MWWRKTWKAESFLLYCLTLLIILVSIFYLHAPWSLFFLESVLPFITHINVQWMEDRRLDFEISRVLSCRWHLVYCLKFAWWDPGAVRRITSKICLRRHIELQKGVSVSGHAKSEVTTSETKSRAGTWTHEVSSRTLICEQELRCCLWFSGLFE